MHPVEHLPWHLAAADAVEVWQILAPPSVRECPGVDRQTALLRDGGHFRANPAAPVDNGAEDIEGEHLEIRWCTGRHAGPLTLCQLEVRSVDRVLGVPQDVEQPRAEWDEDPVEVGVRLLQRPRPRVAIRGDLDAKPLFRSSFDLPTLRCADDASLTG